MNKESKFDSESFSVDLKKDVRKRTDRPLTPLSASFNFVITMVGTAMVATPYQFKLTTPLLGVFTDIILGVLCWFAAVCIFNAASITDATSFIDVGKKIWGHNTKGLVISHLLISLPVAIVLIGALGGYVIIASATFEFYLNMNQTLIRVILTVFIAILGTIKTFEFSKYISYPAFFAFLLIVIFILVTTIQLYGQIDSTPATFHISNYLQGLPVLALGLNGHMGLPGMASEMKKSRHSVVPYYLFVSQFIVVIYNCIVGYFPSTMFGDQIGTSVIDVLNEKYLDIYGSVPAILLAANIMLSTVVIIQAPLLVIPCKEIILDRGKYSVREHSIVINAICSAGICFIAGAIAILIPDVHNALNTVSTVGGLVTTGACAGILSLYTETTVFAKARAWIIILVGFVLLGANFYSIYCIFSGQCIVI